MRLRHLPGHWSVRPAWRLLTLMHLPDHEFRKPASLSEGLAALRLGADAGGLGQDGINILAASLMLGILIAGLVATVFIAGFIDAFGTGLGWLSLLSAAAFASLAAAGAGRWQRLGVTRPLAGRRVARISPNVEAALLFGCATLILTVICLHGFLVTL